MALRRFVVLIALALAPLLVSMGVGLQPGQANVAPSDARTAPAALVLKVHTSTPRHTAQKLITRGYDVLETRVGTDLLVMGDTQVRDRLTRQGFRVSLHQKLPTLSKAATKTFYGGYQTNDEYAAHLGAVAAAYPSLAVTYDVGDSWLKTQNAALGNDLVAICITALNPGDCQLTPASAKPRFFLMATVHARELTATEIADRWVTELTSKYGIDPEITSIVNNTELWVLPMANPDGREIAEPGTPTPYLQRKNANNSAGGACANPPTASSHAGVDINRNHSFLWGGVGTSAGVCDQTYRGTAAASEPETQALQTLMSQLFADNRGPAITNAAPTTTPGLMMTLHSYGNLVLFPWGHVNTASPNDAGLRSMAFRLNYFNGYTAGQPGQVLYNTTGTTDDWAYGTLGVAATTVEVGPSSGTCSGFVPAYSCQASFWTTNRSMLIYAAKLARQPYALALGPNTHTLALTPTSTTAGTSVALSARGQDSAYGSAGVSRPASQRVTAAQYYIDVPPWAGGTPLAMTATDGSFNSASEAIRATISTTSLAPGQHLIFVRSRDLNGNWGPVSTGALTIS